MTRLGNLLTTISLIPFLVITVSCKDKDVAEKTFPQNITIGRNIAEDITFSIDSLSLVLDSVTVNIIHYCQFIPDFDGKSCLSFLNENTNSLYFYDIHSKALIHKIDLREFGIKNPVQGYLYSEKEIYTYSYPDASLTCVDLNSKKTVFSKTLYDGGFDRSNPFFMPKPFPLTCMPIQRIGDIIVLSGMVAGESPLENSDNRPVITLFDTETAEITHVVNYPTIYQKANWGGGLSYRSAYYDINDNKDIVVSFPAYDELIVYSIREGSIHSHFAGSNKVKKIRPFSFNRSIFGDSDKLWEWYLNNPSYENILYDEYRNCYYRITKLPQNADYNPKIGTQKPTVIIVLDESYSFVGEFSLPYDLKFVTSNAFVTSDGICIQKKEQNEDLISFYLIRPII